MGNWEGIVVHHTASPTGVWQGGRWRKIGVEDVRRWHLGQGYKEVGYHYLIDGDGEVWPGRSLEEVGAHCRAGRRNHTHLGVAVIGNMEYQAPSPAQMESLIKLCRALMERHGIPAGKVELHKQVPGAATLCPGRYFPVTHFYGQIKEKE